MGKGEVNYIIPDLREEFEKIMRENNLKGKGSLVTAQKIGLNYMKVGKRAEQMYRGLTFDLFPVKPKRKK